MVYEKTLRRCQNRKTAFLYPDVSGHWYRNLNLPNAMLKINSMDGLRGMAYAEAERTESGQTLEKKSLRPSADALTPVTYIKMGWSDSICNVSHHLRQLLFYKKKQSGVRFLSIFFINRYRWALWRKWGQLASSGCVNSVCQLPPDSRFVFVTAIVKETQQRVTNILVTLIGMLEHYQWPRSEMYQVHFWNSPRFLNELGPCFPNAAQGQAFLFFFFLVCVFHKSQPRSVLERHGDGNAGCLSWAQCKHRQRTDHCVRRSGGPTTCSHCKHSQLFECEVGVRVCARPCTCARDSCGQIQIWSHTLSQCSLFSFHRYVNSTAKACIWCTCKVYPKEVES